ncbi:HK97 family phage prohead protease [Gulosibacter bifidus]|uniref:HK97 family phage prohead protease n=1 Tax=Gulosibacter bifidus TaxID=272239 RepID=A0ABW5RJ98_9MICO|nr:HK97 family phage prohead protease [Gulosibacter bifidus]
MKLQLEALAVTDVPSRQITGIIASHGTPSTTQRVQLAADALKPRQPLSRVKLLIDHKQDQPVGVLTAIEATPDGTRATFTLPEGAESDAALASASAGLRDGLSVGFVATKHELAADGVIHVHEAELFEVSLVAIPDFAAATVETVHASANTDKEIEPMPTTTEAPEAPEVTTSETTALAATPVAPRVEVTHRPLNLQAALSTVSSAINNGDRNAIMLALADIVPSDDAGNGFIGRDDWIGELWTASGARRQWIDAFGGTKPLTSLKRTGWRWKKRPKPGKYDGNKTEVPTGKATTESYTVTAERWAGGWDIDRIFIDLADPGFLESFWNAALVEYAADSDADVAKKIAAAATTGKGGTDSLLTALKHSARDIRRIGGEMTTVFMADDLYDAYAALKQSDVPHWLANSVGGVDLRDQSANVGNIRIESAPELKPGQLLAADARAVTIREKAPIQLKAFDVAHAGIDLGFYSYGLVEIHDPRVIVSRTVTSTAEPSE